MMKEGTPGEILATLDVEVVGVKVRLAIYPSTTHAVTTQSCELCCALVGSKYCFWSREVERIIPVPLRGSTAIALSQANSEVGRNSHCKPHQVWSALRNALSPVETDVGAHKYIAIERDCRSWCDEPLTPQPC